MLLTLITIILSCKDLNEVLYKVNEFLRNNLSFLFFKNLFYLDSIHYKQGLLIDIHGQSHPEGWIELGYLLTSSELNSTSNLIDPFQKYSLNSLAAKSNYSFEDLIRRNVSLGGIMQLKHNLKVVPSPEYLSPNGGNYYSGGFITKEYSTFSKKARINAIQIESPYSLRVDGAIENYSDKVANSIFEFYTLHKLNE